MIWGLTWWWQPTRMHMLITSQVQASSRCGWPSHKLKVLPLHSSAVPGTAYLDQSATAALLFPRGDWQGWAESPQTTPLPPTNTACGERSPL